MNIFSDINRMTFKSHSHHNKGFSVIQLIIVLSILGILALIVLPTLSKFRSEQVLKNTTEDIISLLKEARSNTLTSYNSSNYGVHFQSGQMTYFTGSTYSSGSSSNKTVVFDPAVLIPTTGGINLSGGGSDVVFTRLSGDVSSYGTIVVQLVSDSTRQKTITITKTGSVSSN